MNYKVPSGTVDAARSLLAEARPGRNVEQVHQIVLRDIDANQGHPKILTLIPLGGVLGVAITTDGEWPKDEDILFVSMAALGNTLPALGFTARVPAAFLIAPKRGEPQPAETFDEADNMCPNCVTPWKCNGPHLSDQTVAAQNE